MPKLHPFAIIGIILLATFLPFLWNELRNKDLDAMDDELQVASYMEDVIYDSIYKGIANHQEQITISMESYDGNNSEEIFSQFQKVRTEHPEFFWVTGGANLEGKTIGGITNYTLTIETRCDISEVPQMEQELESIVTQIINGANANCGTDYEKALFVHDTIIHNCEYDEDTYYQNMSDPYDGNSLAYSAYGCLVNRNAVCEGYTKAYMLIMNRMGIECGYVRGTATNSIGTTGLHSWNYIKLDEDYYMVDVTWDDPVGTEKNICCYDYFCVTTEMISVDHQIETPQEVPLCCGTKYVGIK